MKTVSKYYKWEVPADMGSYEIINLGKEPIRIHKTMLRDGYKDVEL